MTDINYGWDSRDSLFMCHHPGLYFFTFSVKGSANEGDHFKLVLDETLLLAVKIIIIIIRVSLMKNGEEVVSVGGATSGGGAKGGGEQRKNIGQVKNIGAFASNAIILNLEEVNDSIAGCDGRCDIYYDNLSRVTGCGCS